MAHSRCRTRRLAARFLLDALRSLLDGRTWRRHPAPFAKTRRGRERRAERLFVRTSHHEVLQ